MIKYLDKLIESGNFALVQKSVADGLAVDPDDGILYYYAAACDLHFGRILSAENNLKKFYNRYPKADKAVWLSLDLISKTEEKILRDRLIYALYEHCKTHKIKKLSKKSEQFFTAATSASGED